MMVRSRRHKPAISVQMASEDEAQPVARHDRAAADGPALRPIALACSGRMDVPNRLGTVSDSCIAALTMISSAPVACSGERLSAAAVASGSAPSATS
jgi:hypothetical protein